MSRVDRQLRNLAEQLIAHETREHRHSGRNSSANSPVFEKLRQPLATLVGSAGFGALLTRALALSCPEFPWLCALQVKADGSLEGLAVLEAQAEPGKITEGRIAVLAQMLGLLMALIGEPLTVQLIHDVWPKLPLNGSYSGNEDENKNAP